MRLPLNPQSLNTLKNGKKAAEARLDSFFVKLNANYGQTLFAAGNELDFEVSWVYNWAGAPYKGQEVVRRIIAEQYSNKAGGLPGNDDLGATQAWYVFANIGLCPMIPGVGGFSINSNSFLTVKITMGNGKMLTIFGGPEVETYIQNLKVNSKVWDNTLLPYNTIRNNGSMDFQLSATPNKNWASTEQPPSFK